MIVRSIQIIDINIETTIVISASYPNDRNIYDIGSIETLNINSTIWYIFCCPVANIVKIIGSVMTFKILSIIINCKKMTDFWGTFPNQRERIDSALKKIGKERNAIRKVHIKDVLINILFNPLCSLLEYAL